MPSQGDPPYFTRVDSARPQEISMPRHVLASLAGALALAAVGCGGGGGGQPPEPVVYAGETHVELAFREGEGHCAHVPIELRPWYRDANL